MTRFGFGLIVAKTIAFVAVEGDQRRPALPIGRWQGDAVVVETTNFHPRQVFRGASQNLKAVERFTRTGPDTILYELERGDPTTLTERVGVKFLATRQTSCFTNTPVTRVTTRSRTS